MRNSKYLIIILIAFLPVKLIAQAATSADMDLTGLWKGTLYNDSTQKYYRYEIGISQEKGKLSGFSHTFFLVDDKEFYGVKKVKVRKMDGKIIVEDAGLIANNYPEAPAKGVRQLNVLTLEIKDSIMMLTGPFSTNRTKQYASLTGTISLQRKNDFWQSALVPHLQELKLSNNLSFVKKENDLAKEAADKKTEQTRIAAKDSKREIEIEKAIAKNPVKKEELAKADTKAAEPKETASDIATSKRAIEKENEAAQSKSVAASKAEPIKRKTSNEAKRTETKPTVTSLNDAAKETSTVIVRSTAPAAEVESRINVVQQTVYFTSDSLKISLYDNGEVDGDTVSVLMNGKIIMAKEGLSTNAVRKTIYAGHETDSIELVMYAENLGSIAPNTGLLVVHDGKSIYEIRFSGDLKKNSSIILRRRKN